LDTGAQRIWSFFKTHAEPLSLKAAACWPSCWAITMLLSAAWAETQANKAAITRLWISLVIVILLVFALRFGVRPMYGEGAVELVVGLPGGVCKIYMRRNTGLSRRGSCSRNASSLAFMVGELPANPFDFLPRMLLRAMPCGSPSEHAKAFFRILYTSSQPEPSTKPPWTQRSSPGAPSC